MAVDISGISFFAPLIAFLLVFVISFAVLFKTSLLGENKWVQLFVSFLVATVFISAAGATDFVLNITPWFVVLLVLVFFVLVLTSFAGKTDWLGSAVGKVVLVIFALGIIIVGFISFSSYLHNPDVLVVKNWLFQSNVWGAILVLVISAIAAWILVKSK